MPRPPKHCRWKDGKLTAFLTIPPDCRFAFNGKKQFRMPLHTSDPTEGAVKAALLVRDWKSRIVAVRDGHYDPLRDEIDKLAAAYRKLGPLDDASALLVPKVIRFVFQQVGGMTELAQRAALHAAHGDALRALQGAPQATKATNAWNTITNPSEAQTPFATHAEKWHGTLRASATSDHWRSTVYEFDKAVGQPIERLSGHHIQTWIEDLLGSKAPATVRYKLVALRAYWSWLVSHEFATGNPFAGVQVKSRQTKIERKLSAKQGFPPHEVPGLWRDAEAYGDCELSFAIQIGAAMGWRLEEIAQLRIADVKPNGGILVIDGGLKTEAGLRVIPVPSILLPLIKRLCKRTDSDGFLLVSTANNKRKQRGGVFGQRFGRLKRRLGYGRVHSFNSLRHTYLSLLAHADVPLDVIRELGGHEDGGDDNARVTLGYIDPRVLRARLKWLDKAIRFDSPEADEDDDGDV